MTSIPPNGGFSGGGADVTGAGLCATSGPLASSGPPRTEFEDITLTVHEKTRPLCGKIECYANRIFNLLHGLIVEHTERRKYCARNFDCGHLIALYPGFIHKTALPSP